MKKNKRIVLIVLVLVIAVFTVWFVSRPSIKNKSVYSCDSDGSHIIFYGSSNHFVSYDGKIGSSGYNRKLNGSYRILGDEEIPVTLMGNQIKVGHGANETTCTLVDVYADKDYAEIQNDILEKIIIDIEAQITYYEKNPDKITSTESKDGSMMSSIDVLKSKLNRIAETMNQASDIKR